MPSPPTAFFDLDGTLTRGDTYLAYLLGFLYRQPKRWPRALLLPPATIPYFLGLRDNTWLKTAFLKIALGGVTRAEIDAWTDLYLERLLAADIRAGAKAALERHRQAGERLVLATASFDFYAEPLAGRLGMHAVVCTRAAWDDDDRLTGEIIGNNCHGAQKRQLVQAYLRESGSDGPLTFYTDHHTDMHLLECVDFPVTVNPTGRLRRAIAGSNIAVVDWR